MFDDPIIPDLQIKPDLRNDESVLAAKSTTVGNSIRDNVIVIVTTYRIITGLKKGRSIDEGYDDTPSVLV